MARVETSLRESVGHVDNYIATAAGHLLEAGGKRFRPLLTVLASQAGPHAGKVHDDVVKAAVVVELTHLASLYHDDVMDEAALRRGSQSANARWGNTVAILTGDLLFARASQLVADLGAEAVRIQAMTFEVLCSGQIRETVGPGRGAGPGRALPDGAGREDRRADRDGRPVRGVVRRCGRGDHRRHARVRRADRRRVPAGRRPDRPGLGVRPVRQDPRHRPARGRGHAAGALRARVHGPGRRAAAGAGRRSR